MAVIIPAVMAFAAAGGTVAGVTAALTMASGFATFATVAGGFLTTIGGLTKSKALTKVGQALSLVGGVAGIANAASGAAGEAAGAAAGEVGSEVAEAAAGATADSVAQSGTLIPDGAIGSIGVTPPPDTLGTLSLGQSGGAVADAATGVASGSGLNLETASFMDQARLAKSPMEAMTAAAGDGASSVVSPAGSSQLARAATEIKDVGHLQSLLEKAGQGLKGLNTVLRDNKELVNLGGKALEAAFDPQAEAMEAQLNLLEQRRRRLNSPIAMRYTPQVSQQQAGAPLALAPIGG